MKKTKPKPFSKKKKILEVKYGNNFYTSQAWLELREKVLFKYRRQCALCGRVGSAGGLRGVSLHVDHIKPRSRYPELELDFNNLQVLCKECNLEKLDFNEADWRPSRG